MPGLTIRYATRKQCNLDAGFLFIPLHVHESWDPPNSKASCVWNKMFPGISAVWSQKRSWSPPTLTQDDEEPWSSLQHWQSSPAMPHLESVAEVHTVNLQVWLWNTFFMSVTISGKKILAFKLPTVLSHSWNKGLVCMKTEKSILIHFIKCSHWLRHSRYILLNAYSLPATVLIPNISYSWREYLWGSFPCHQFPLTDFALKSILL